MGIVTHGWTNGQIMLGRGGGSFTNAFSSNLNIVNLKGFPNHGNKALSILKNYGRIYP